MMASASESGEIQRRFLVRGRVQGVGFRFWTRRMAQELGVTGTVRNRPDGSVEVHARASEPALDHFAACLRSGPRGAWVEGVECSPSGDELPDAFLILRWGG